MHTGNVHRKKIMIRTAVVVLVLLLAFTATGCDLIFGFFGEGGPEDLSASLFDLSVSDGTLSPVFDPLATDYTVNVDNSVDSITVTGDPFDPIAFVSENSGAAQSLDVGSNDIVITVTAADGVTTKNYTVTVIRAASTGNAALSSLTVSEGTLSPAFDASTIAYSVSVANSVDSITVTGTADDSNASLSANNGAAQSLSVGANDIVITVTAADGVTTKDYTVTVTREAPSDNAALSSLTVSEGTLSPAFDASTIAYSVSVANSVDSITVTGTADDSNASLSANNGAAQSLSVGANDIVITVTAADGTTTKDYTVTVTREAPSDNATLSGLTVSEGTLSPAFDAATIAYSVSVANSVDSITVTGTADDANASLSANSGVAQSLSVGANDIVITVTAADGTTTKDYTVTVTREGAPVSFNSPYGVVKVGSSLYVADFSAHSIVKVNPETLEVTTFAGNPLMGSTDGTGEAASFNTPIMAATDGNYLYVTDYGAGSIRRINLATREVSTILGTGTYSAPTGIVYSAGTLYVATESGQLYTIDISDPANAVSTMINLSGGFLGSVYEMVLSGTTLYVADHDYGNIKSIALTTDGNTVNGAVSSIADSVLTNPVGLFLEGTDLYVTDYGQGKVLSIDISEGGGYSSSTVIPSISYPWGIVKDGTTFYITLLQDATLQKIEVL